MWRLVSGFAILKNNSYALAIGKYLVFVSPYGLADSEIRIPIAPDYKSVAASMANGIPIPIIYRQPRRLAYI